MSGLKHINVVMQQRYDTKTNWENNDTEENKLILEAGEIGVETDTHKIKVGDGETRWSELPYIGLDYSIPDEYKKAIDALGYVYYDDSQSGSFNISDGLFAESVTLTGLMELLNRGNGDYAKIRMNTNDFSGIVTMDNDTATERTLQDELDKKPNMNLYIITYDSTKFTSDIDAIQAYLDTAKKIANRGDIAIVKKIISTTDNTTTSDLYTSYVHGSSKWFAMSGNVSSDNVLISEDITMAGNYTAVGNLTKSQNETKIFSTKGKTVTQALKDIFSKRIIPTSYTKPNATIKIITTTGNQLAGTNKDIGFELTFNKGKYPYGPDIEGVNIVSYRVELKGGSIGVFYESQNLGGTDSNPTIIQISDAFKNIAIEDNHKYTLSCNIKYSVATNHAYDNMGDNTDLFIPAGSLANINSSNNITGYSKYYLGALTTDIENLNTSILTGSAPIPTSTNLSIPDGTNYVYIIYAISTGIKSMTVLDSNNSDMDVTSIFGDADTTSLPGYKVYKYAPKVSLGANTYKIKFTK